MVKRTNNNVMVSWSLTAAAYALETKSSIAAGWSTAAYPKQTNGSVISVTLSPTNTASFFRLKK